MPNKCTDLGTRDSAHGPFFRFLLDTEGKTQFQTNLLKPQRLNGELWQITSETGWCSIHRMDSPVVSWALIIVPFFRFFW